MGCHLHEVVEGFHTEIAFQKGLSEETQDDIKNAIDKIYPKLMCFDLGDSAQFDNIGIEYDIAALPYTECWFEYIETTYCDIPTRVGVAIVHHEDPPFVMNKINAEYELLLFIKQQGQRHWAVDAVATLESLSGGNGFIRPKAQTCSDDVACTLDRILSFLTVLNCSNVTRTEHKPDAKLQKKRLKKGKQPLFSYWTLDIDLSKDRNQPQPHQGGTHASPRVHLRRGHPRQFKPGQFTWVQPCMVGNGHGMVHKDYRLK